MMIFPKDLPDAHIGTSSQHHVRYLQAEFGDGYGHRVLDGINTHHVEWSVTWQQIETDVANKIVAFLIGKMGIEPFLWVPPKATDAVSVKCDVNTLKRTPLGNLDNLQAVFVEVFDF